MRKKEKAALPVVNGKYRGDRQRDQDRQILCCRVVSVNQGPETAILQQMQTKHKINAKTTK